MSLSKLVSVPLPEFKEEVVKVEVTMEGSCDGVEEGGGGGMELDIWRELEVLTDAALAFDSLAKAGVIVDGDHGRKLRDARKKLEEVVKQRVAMAGEEKIAELTGQLKRKDEAFEKLSKKYKQVGNRKIWAEFELKKMMAAVSLQGTRVKEEPNDAEVVPSDLAVPANSGLISNLLELPTSSGVVSLSSYCDDMNGNEDSTTSTSGSKYNLRQRSSLTFFEGDEEEDSEEEPASSPTKPSAAVRAERRSRSGSEVRVISDLQRSPGSGRFLARTGGFQCAQCDLSLSSMYSLSRHVKRVHKRVRVTVKGQGQRRFACTLCEKKFFQSGHLKRHQDTHNLHRKRNFKCSVCFNRYYTSDQLRRHKRIHRPEQPFKCPQCPKRFKLKEQLVKHSLVHSEQKRFPCELCDKGFKRSADLRRHVRTHSGEEGKWYRCPYCEARFADPSNWRRHQKRLHKAEMAERRREENWQEGPQV